MIAARLIALGCCALLASCMRTPAGDASDAQGWKVHGEALSWQGKTPPAVVRLAPAGTGEQRLLRVAGRVIWNDHYTARVFTPVSGRVEELYAEPGARVRRGQPLLKLSSGDFGQWQSDLRKAQADAQAARRADDRARALLTTGIIAQRDAEQSAADRQRAEAELARAQTRLRQLGEFGAAVNSSFVLRSPIDGVIVERAASVGTEMRTDATLPLFIITDPSRLNVVVDLPESLASSVKTGQQLKFVCSGQAGVSGTLRVTNVPSAVDPTTRSVRALGAVSGEHPTIPGEALVQVEIPVAVTDAASVTVPADALVLVGADYYVFAFDGRQYRRRKVAIGELGNPMVEVRRGLHSGDSIVVDGSLYLEQILEQGS